MAKAPLPETYPTEGGSYVRQGGKLDQVERTKPAPPPAAAPTEEAPAPPATTKE